MTMDDYLAARLVSTPFGLFDCDVPIDGSTIAHSFSDCLVLTNCWQSFSRSYASLRPRAAPGLLHQCGRQTAD